MSGASARQPLVVSGSPHRRSDRRDLYITRCPPFIADAMARTARCCSGERWGPARGGFWRGGRNGKMRFRMAAIITRAGTARPTAPWTNGFVLPVVAVGATAAGTGDPSIVVKYTQGEKWIVITPSAHVVRNVFGSKDDSRPAPPSALRGRSSPTAAARPPRSPSAGTVPGRSEQGGIDAAKLCGWA
jgi:hypothetical protein